MANAEGIVFFQTGGIALALFPRHDLAKDANVSPDGDGFSGMTLAYNTRTHAEVDAVLEDAQAAGARLVKPAQEAVWGGYSGYFADSMGDRVESILSDGGGRKHSNSRLNPQIATRVTRQLPSTVRDAGGSWKRLRHRWKQPSSQAGFKKRLGGRRFIGKRTTTGCEKTQRTPRDSLKHENELPRPLKTKLFVGQWRESADRYSIAVNKSTSTVSRYSTSSIRTNF
jgi:hypothetical protein